MNKDNKNTPEVIIFIYELEQIPVVIDAYKMTPGNVTIISFDLWAYNELRRQGVRVVKSTEYVELFWYDKENLTLANEIGREWHRIPEFSFFTHKNTAIGESVEYAVAAYFEKLLGAIESVSEVLKKNPQVTSIITPHSRKKAPPTSSAIALHEIMHLSDAVSIVGKRANINTVLLGEKPLRIKSGQSLRLLCEKVLFTAFNWVIGISAKKKSVRLFVSDFWRHILSITEQEDDVEVIFMDRSEIKNIPILKMLKHRIRFVHPSSIQTKEIKSEVLHSKDYFERNWDDAHLALRSWFEKKVPDVEWCHVEDLFGYIVKEYAQKVVHDIEAVEHIIKKHNINRVLVRAGVSAQHHFFVLGQVSYTLGIPAIELQHGIETQTVNSLFSRLKCGYLIAYGKCMRDRMVYDHKYSSERILPLGSPRFDRYIDMPKLTPTERTKTLRSYGLDPSRSVVLCAVPGEGTYLYPSYFTTYECESVFKNMREFQKLYPDTQFIFKFRRGYLTEQYRVFVRKLFSDGGFACVDDIEIFNFFQISDIFITPRSTLMYEATLASVPTIVYPVKFRDVDFVEFYKKGFLLPHTSYELFSDIDELKNNLLKRNHVLKNAKSFLDKNYSFNGNSSKKIANFLKEDILAYTASDM